MNHLSAGRARRRAIRIGALGAIACAVTAGVFVATTSAQAASQPLVAMPGSAAPTFVSAHRDSAVAAGQRVSVAVSLKLRNTDQLAALDAAVSTPGSADYGHYLSPAEFAAEYGPTAADVAQVREYLTSEGLSVTGVSGNNQVVDAAGPASKVAAAFDTSLSNYTDGSQKYYANDSAVSLPADMASVVQGVSGLSSRAVAHPENVPTTPKATPAASPVGGFSPTQYDGAYRLSQVGADGTGVTVALWEFDGYKASDLTSYNTQYGLSGPAATTVEVDGQSYDSRPGDGEGEVELDSEIVRGVAPKATQLVYEAPNSDQGQIDMANQIVSQDRVSVISISWGGCEQDSTSSSITSTNNAFSQAVAEGMSIYSASGDDGSRDCTRTASGSGVKAVDFPGSSVFDTSVGGTTLTLSGTSYGSEKAWSDAGGGVSTVFAKPSWQPGTNTKRTVPDVSSNADPNTGFSVFSAGSWTEFGGTSCAAPLWSGFTALYNQKAATAGKANLGFGNPAFYQLLGGSSYGTTFHDVKTGSNQDFSATTGYDEVTGIGSPIADALTTSLLGTGTGTGGNTVTVTNPGAQTTAVNTAVSLTVNGTDSAGAALTYSATGLPTGLSINASSGVISGTATTAGTFAATVSAADSTGASGSASFSWTVGSGSSTCSGQKLGNPGFESGNTVWSASTGVIGQNASQGEPTHSGTYDAWLDGYGTTHTDTVTQSVAIPAGCHATLSFYLHIDTAETTTSTAYDKLTVKIGSTTLATYSNLNKASGYVLKSFDVSSSAGSTVTVSFSGSEDSSEQTSFVLDDTSVALS
ncbi:MAG TPA: protease pro-enzyme activation domain-containing protein [Pseudonocardiaceae bacterium]|jgi:kumamolisin|nr:protease pro-enzyme activation domain-containing protein [Pseudonocardiaceae bacterium]